MRAANALMRRLARMAIARMPVGMERSRAATAHAGIPPVDEQNVETRIMIRKLKSGEYRLYSRKKDPKSGKRRNLGTFSTREAAVKHERAVQFFKHH
jgi:hypothetical protein